MMPTARHAGRKCLNTGAPWGVTCRSPSFSVLMCRLPFQTTLRCSPSPALGRRVGMSEVRVGPSTGLGRQSLRVHAGHPGRLRAPSEICS